MNKCEMCTASDPIPRSIVSMHTHTHTHYVYTYTYVIQEASKLCRILYIPYLGRKTFDKLNLNTTGFGEQQTAKRIQGVYM